MLKTKVSRVNKRLVFLALVAVFTLSGCQDKSMSDLRQFVADVYKDKKPEIEPLPVIRPFKAFAYSAANENDPFSVDNISDGEAGGVASIGELPDADRAKGPLEAFPLDALSMVGTLSKKDKPWVIVKTSQGTVLLAQVGDYIGENNGKIKQILTDEQRVLLVETVPDPSGRWVTRDVEITVDEQ